MYRMGFYRENDYLWGRLHTADRLVDVIMQAAFAQDSDHGIDVDSIKQQLFSIILDAEVDYLQRSDELLNTIRAEIEAKKTPQ